MDGVSIAGPDALPAADAIMHVIIVKFYSIDGYFNMNMSTDNRVDIECTGTDLMVERMRKNVQVGTLLQRVTCQ